MKASSLAKGDPSPSPTFNDRSLFCLSVILYIFLLYPFQVINLDQNDAAMSIALCKFPHMDPTSTFCLVGVAKDYQLSPR